MAIKIISEPNAKHKDKDAVRNALDEFNLRITGQPVTHVVSIFLRDEQGAIMGGLLGEIWGGWLHIDILWIDESLRGQDYGTKLMQAAEDEARAKGCTNAHVETASFQARPFYERLGYAVFAELPDYPTGHAFYFLRKKL